MIWYLHCPITWCYNDNSGHIENIIEKIYILNYIKNIYFLFINIYIFLSSKLNIFPVEGTNLVQSRAFMKTYFL